MMQKRLLSWSTHPPVARTISASSGGWKGTRRRFPSWQRQGGSQIDMATFSPTLTLTMYKNIYRDMYVYISGCMCYCIYAKSNQIKSLVIDIWCVNMLEFVKLWIPQVYDVETHVTWRQCSHYHAATQASESVGQPHCHKCKYMFKHHVAGVSYRRLSRNIYIFFFFTERDNLCMYPYLYMYIYMSLGLIDTLAL